MAETIRIQHNRNYTVISNDCIRDSRLSFKARGLLVLLLSYPDGWKVNTEHLSTQSEKDGKSAVSSALKELEEIGYLERKQTRVNGKITGYESVIREVPSTPCEPKGRRTKKPQSGFPYPENPDMENSDMEKPYLEKPYLENQVHNKYPIQELPKKEITREESENALSPSKEDLEDKKENAAEQISHTSGLKEGISGKPMNPHEGSFSAAARSDATQQVKTKAVDPFYNTRPKSKDILWAWLPEGEWFRDGALDPDFWNWMAENWVSKFGSTIHEAKSNVISHFRKQPEQLVLKWDEYSVKNKKQVATVSLPAAVLDWDPSQHLKVWEQYINSKNLDDFYSKRTWNQVYLEYALVNQPRFDWSKHLSSVSSVSA